MNTNRNIVVFLRYLVVTGLWLQTNATASEVSIAPPASVDAGDVFVIKIMGDFSGQGLIAGGVTLQWNASVFNLNSMSFDLSVDLGFSCPGSDNCPSDGAGSKSIFWGQFLSDLVSTTPSPAVEMATLTFTAIGDCGEAGQFSLADASGVAGGWFGAGFASISAPVLTGTTIEIGPDEDEDGVCDAEDNCPVTYNPLQEDFDGDGLGYVCDNTCAATMDFSHTFMDGDVFVLLVSESIDFDGTLESGADIGFSAPNVTIHPNTNIEVGSLLVTDTVGCCDLLTHVRSCLGECVPDEVAAAEIGDAVCDSAWNCAEFSYDGGDCPVP